MTDIIEDPVLRQRLRFTRTTEADGAEVLHAETWVEPGGGVTPHIHPSMNESFEVLNGNPSFLSGKEWITAEPGETVEVPAGTRHAYRNKSDREVHMVCHARPPSTLQEFLEDTVRLSRSGGLSRHAMPKSVGALLQGIVMAEAYNDMVILLFPPFPPPAIQRLIFPALARAGARRGYRAGHIGEAP
jgi:quercetin dioxygenase-like cupin family protein